MILENDELLENLKIESNKSLLEFYFADQKFFLFDLTLHFDQSMKLNFGEFGEFISGLRALNNSSFSKFEALIHYES